MAQRDGYSSFVNDWLFGYTGTGGGDPDLTREQLWEEVVEKFAIKRVYRERITAWRKERERLNLKSKERADRKQAALEEEAHANARIETLGSGKTTYSGKIH